MVSFVVGATNDTNVPFVVIPQARRGWRPPSARYRYTSCLRSTLHCTLLNKIAVCALYFALVQGQKEVEVHWHPFQLNPNAPKEGINKLGWLLLQHL